VALDDGQLAASGGKPPAAPRVEVPYQVAPGALAWDPLTLGAGGGFFERLSRGWSFLGQAWNLLGRDGRLLLPSVFSMVASFVLLGIAFFVLRGTGLGERLGSKSPGARLLMYEIILPVSLVIYLVSYFFQGITVRLVGDMLQGRRCDLSLGVKDSLQNLGALAMLAGASALVSLVAGALRGNGRGWARERAADAVDSAWHAVVLLTLPIIILEDVGLIAAFGRAKQLHGRHVGDLLVAWFGVGLLNRVLGTVTMVLAGGLAFGLYALGGAALLPVIIGVVIVAVLLVSVFTAYLNSAYFTCLYLWAAAAEAAGQPVPAPEPLAAFAW
jgi:hypothetical protein